MAASRETVGFMSLLLLLLLHMALLISPATGIGVNWGIKATHPLPPPVVVQLLKDNGFEKVKLFDADGSILKALGNSGIQVMVGIPNDMLLTISKSVQAAEDWVAQNVSSHVSSNAVDIRYVAVGNEPFLSAYNGTYIGLTLPALENVQAALIKAGLGSKVKVTVPLNADVYQSNTNAPSGGDFRSDIHDLMVQIVKLLNDNGAPFTINVYPFISLYNDPSFPIDFAFFDGSSSAINDGGKVYDNVFDAAYDTLVWALTKNGYGNMSIIVGEIGWPTDGDKNANPKNAQQFNQGFMSRVISGKGTPMRPNTMDAYLFSLIDEDAKSIQPGNFERHWGIFYFDGQPKYQLKLGSSSSNGLASAKNVHFLAKKWCVMSPTASLDDSQVGPSVSYACSHADCTSLGYETSCGNLDTRQNISYAFNNYYQIVNQLDTACGFPDNLSVVTTNDPSVGDCKFRIMIQSVTAANVGKANSLRVNFIVFVLLLVFTLV